VIQAKQFLVALLLPITPEVHLIPDLKALIIFQFFEISLCARVDDLAVGIYRITNIPN